MTMKYALLVILLGRLLPADEVAFRTPLSARGLNETLIGIAEKLTPAVVMVATESYQPVEESAPGAATFGLRQGSGSGVIVSEDGYIVTNAHVVAGATRIQVQFSSNGARRGHSIIRPSGRVLPARLIGLDAETDLALVKVDAKPLPFFPLADSDAVRQGQLVVAIGSPVGLESSVSMGVISSVARQLHSDSRVISANRRSY
jgi:serine protease Do